MSEENVRANVPVYSRLIVPAEVQLDQDEFPLSEDGKHRVLPAQGRNMDKLAPINLDWCYPDKADSVEVFFAVYKSTIQGQTSRDLHWSIAWAVQRSSGVAWRQLHVIEEKLENGPPPQPRYVYWGPLTKSQGPTDDIAQRYSLGEFKRPERLRLEELASQTPVMVPDGTWNCQDWILDLFRRMVSAELIRGETLDSVFSAAGCTDDLPCI